jgi:hypothetical protein
MRASRATLVSRESPKAGALGMTKEKGIHGNYSKKSEGREEAQVLVAET